MRSKSPVPVQVIKRERKEQAVRDFVLTHIEQTSTDHSSSSDAPSVMTLLARSPSSPVALAVVSLHEQIADAGYSVRVIFSLIGGDAASLAWSSPDVQIAFAREIRVITNASLHDAHEQMMLDDSTSWVGDSLRRDPCKNDAYECYAADCAQAARAAQLSFERIWTMCDAVAAYPAAGDAPVAGPALPPGNLAAIDDGAAQSQPMSGTRH